MSGETDRNGRCEIRILRTTVSNGQIAEEQINHEVMGKYAGE